MSRTKRKLPTRFLRHPKTFAERKASEAAIRDGIKVRPKRTSRHLPSDYDDKVIAARKEQINQE